MSDTTKAVFLSYASQDAEAAKKICDALRAADVEVWFDQSELVGGDAWDAKIKRQIKECALFVPVITPNTNARTEGYFRREWKQAVERTHDMADDVPFLFPIVIGDVTDTTARVPDKFRDVQWTRLRLDETPAELAARVAKLLRGGDSVGAALRREGSEESRHKAVPAKSPSWLRYAWAGVGVLFALVYAVRPLFQPARRAESKPPAAVSVTPSLSEARQLTQRARVLLDKIDSTADDFAAAESLAKRAIELDPTDGEIWAVSSRINSAYLSRNFERSDVRREAARSQAERAVKLAPDSPEAWLALGRGVQGSDSARSEEAIRQGLKLAPNDGRLLLALAGSYRRQNRFDDALAVYEQAAAQSDVRPLARYDQYLIHFYFRRFAEADRCIREAIALVPTTNMVAGLAMLEVTWRGQVAEARRLLAEAPAGVRSQPRVVLTTALVSLMATQPDEALRALDRLPADYINDAWFTGPKGLLTGLAHAQGGSREAARLAWESGLAVAKRSLQEAPNDPEVHLRYGELLGWLGQTEAALQEASVFDELRRRRITDWTYSAARIHAAVGRADLAVPLLAHLLETPPSSRWPLTPALLRIDPLWSKLRGDPRFQKLCEEPSSATNLIAAVKADDKSVAVLAFANLSDDKGNEYFSDGISEELLNVLAKIPDLKVSARTSAFYFKGKQVPMAEIAKQLGVAYVVEGSVRKAGDKVRITAQLIKAADGFHVWSDTFTREMKDVFAVQDEIAGLIAKNLSVQMGVVARPVHQVNSEALALLLEGRHFWALRSFDGFARAGELFAQAIKLDPQWAPAYAALASLQSIQGSYLADHGDLSGDLHQRAKLAARRALELDPALGEPYAALGHMAMHELQWSESTGFFAKALALEPNNATAHDWNADLLLSEGRLDVGLAGYQRALELDPLSPFILWDVSWTLMHAHRYAEALPLIERATALTPGGSVRLGVRRAYLLIKLGRRDEAEAALLPLLPNLRQEQSGVSLGPEAITCLQSLGRQDEADQLVADLFHRFPNDPANGFILVALGRADEAYPFLERARPIMHQILYWDPLLDPLRDDLRFHQVLAKLHLTQEYKVARETLAPMLREQETKK